MNRYQGRYRVESTRLRGWDYRTEGWYFVTVCTQDRACVLGEVEAAFQAPEDPALTWPPPGVRLSAAGRIVAEEWLRTPQVRPEVTLDAWVIMPNHLHGILHLVETPRRGVSSPSAGLEPGSLGAILGQFKSVCTKRIRQSHQADFGWQPRFFDRIIRNEDALHRAREYVHLNPQRWQLDRENLPGIFI